MISNNKTIGRVLAVDNFRVFVKIDENLNGTYKNGVDDIYEIARINSYLIIPVGAERVVAIITRVTMKEEVEFDKHSTSITLPTAARYISATMLGTIRSKNETEEFIQGVYNFPSLDNPVWYVTEKDLKQIFDAKNSSDKINYATDFYLPIGTSPAFSNYKVKICPDQFFVKHAAILGNTGSGKSCTLTSILHNLFKYNYSGEFLKNAHIVIFDTNGEYKSAFLPECKKEDTLLDRINAFYYGGENYPKVPYWFMNWSDFKGFLKPSDGTQAPILNRAIGLAKNEVDSTEKKTLTKTLLSDIENIINCNTEGLKRLTGETNYGNWEWKNGNEIGAIGQAVKVNYPELGDLIIELSQENNFCNTLSQENLKQQIKDNFNVVLSNELEEQILNEQNIDLPTWFDYHALCTKFIDAAIKQESSNNNRISEFISTLRLRMNSFLNDKRIAIPLMLKDDNSRNKNVLPSFLAFILGDFYRFATDFNSSKETFLHNYWGDNNPRKINKSSQISIIDISNLPFEVLESITALLGRIILEFVSHFDIRGKYPIVIVLEEAQNYIAENKDSVAKTVFERIAREGRKYGISLVVCSQRPSELSKTVLSQCNSFIIHRLQNPEDQKYIRGLVSSANADVLEQLPIIPQQHAIVMGDCVRTPIQVRIDDVYPTPNSNNPKYIENWLNNDPIPYEETCNSWIPEKSLREESTESFKKEDDDIPF